MADKFYRVLYAPEAGGDAGGGTGGGSGGGDAGGGSPAPAPAPAARGRIGQSFDQPPGGTPAPTLDELASQRGGIGRQQREPIPGDEGVMAEGDELEQPEGFADADPDQVDELEVDDQGEEIDGGEIFGMQPDALLESLRAGKLPQSMVDTLTLDVPQPDGSTLPMTLAEIAVEFPKGVMRQSVFTRKTEELAHYRKQAHAVIQREQARQQWPKNPQAMYDELVAMPGMLDIPNKTGALYKIAEHIANETRRWKALSPEQQEAEKTLQAAEARAAEVEAREAKLNDRDMKARRADLQVTLQKQLDEALPLAFAKVNVPHSEAAEEIFKQKLAVITDAIPQGEWRGLTQDMIDDAAEATRDRLVELLSKHGTMRRATTPAPKPGQRPPTPAQRAHGLSGTPQRHAQTLSPTPQGGGRPPGTAPAQRSNGRPKQARIGQTPSQFYKR